MKWDASGMATYIRQSNMIEDIHDRKEVEQSQKAWEFLMEQPTLTHAVVGEVQRIITANQLSLRHDQRGVYRNQCRVNVTVGRYRPPAWQDVPDLMNDWLDGLTERTAWVNHVYFEGIHPFVDGNGRTGRMLMWREQILAEDEPMMLRATHRQNYYRALDVGRRLHAADMAQGAR